MHLLIFNEDASRKFVERARQEFRRHAAEFDTQGRVNAAANCRQMAEEIEDALVRGVEPTEVAARLANAVGLIREAGRRRRRERDD